MRSSSARDLVDALRATPRSWSTTELGARWGAPALRAANRSGLVAAVLRGRWAATEHAESVITRAHAATAVLGRGSALIGVNAAAAWGLCCPNQEAVTATAHYGARRSTAAWLRVVRRRDALESRQIGVLTVCAPAVAVVTAHAELDCRAGDELVYASVRTRLATASELHEALEACRVTGRRRELRRAIARAEEGCESVLEADAAQGAFRGAAFSDWVRQHRLLLDGVPVRLDMYHPASRTAVEIDGAAFHSSPEEVAADKRRDVLLARHGIQVVRFGTRDLRTHPLWCRESTLRIASTRLAERLHV